MEYSKQVMKVGSLVFELLSEPLHPNHLNDMSCAEGLAVLGHYYPACPEPELTIGTTEHADNDFLTVLLQDHIGGLQILCDNNWIDVPSHPGALVVNLGDLMRACLMSHVSCLMSFLFLFFPFCSRPKSPFKCEIRRLCVFILEKFMAA